MCHTLIKLIFMSLDYSSLRFPDTIWSYPHDNSGGAFPVCGNSDQQELCRSLGGARHLCP